MIGLNSEENLEQLAINYINDKEKVLADLKEVDHSKDIFYSMINQKLINTIDNYGFIIEMGNKYKGIEELTYQNVFDTILRKVDKINSILLSDKRIESFDIISINNLPIYLYSDDEAFFIHKIVENHFLKFNNVIDSEKYKLLNEVVFFKLKRGYKEFIKTMNTSYYEDFSINEDYKSVIRTNYFNVEDVNPYCYI